MAFPSPNITDATKGRLIVSGGSGTVNLPSGIASGDLLVLVGNTDVGASFELLTGSLPTGWVAEAAGQFDADTANPSFFILTRICDGTEGSTETFSFNGDKDYGYVCLRISSWDGTSAGIELGSPGSSGGALVTSISTVDVTPSWGSADTLFISILFAANAPGAASSTAPTTEFPDGSVLDGISGFEALASTAFAQNTSTVHGSGDTWGLSHSLFLYTYTMAIKPSGGGGGGGVTENITKATLNFADFTAQIGVSQNTEVTGAAPEIVSGSVTVNAKVQENIEKATLELSPKTASFGLSTIVNVTQAELRFDDQAATVTTPTGVVVDKATLTLFDKPNTVSIGGVVLTNDSKGGMLKLRHKLGR